MDSPHNSKKHLWSDIRNQINTKSYKPLVVKGKVQPIDVYEVVGLKQRKAREMDLGVD